MINFFIDAQTGWFILSNGDIALYAHTDYDSVERVLRGEGWAFPNAVDTYAHLVTHAFIKWE
jgi:hypothetical protein